MSSLCRMSSHLVFVALVFHVLNVGYYPRVYLATFPFPCSPLRHNARDARPYLLSCSRPYFLTVRRGEAMACVEAEQSVM